MTKIKHGTLYCYVVIKCRCSECREANRVYQRGARQRRAQRAASGEIEIPHGTVNGYVNYGCRCELCRKVMRQDEARRRVKYANRYERVRSERVQLQRRAKRDRDQDAYNSGAEAVRDRMGKRSPVKFYTNLDDIPGFGGRDK
jgi:hypothetical protein